MFEATLFCFSFLLKLLQAMLLLCFLVVLGTPTVRLSLKHWSLCGDTPLPASVLSMIVPFYALNSRASNRVSLPPFHLLAAMLPLVFFSFTLYPFTSLYVRTRSPFRCLWTGYFDHAYNGSLYCALSILRCSVSLTSVLPVYNRPFSAQVHHSFSVRSSPT